MTLIQPPSTLEKPAPKKLKPLTDLKEYPVPAYQFSIEFDTDIVALFQSVRGISMSREVEQWKAGGENYLVREFPGRISHGHITFETGLSSSNFFWEWMTAGQEDGYAIRKDFTLIQRRPNPGGDTPIFSVIRRWNFRGAFPVSWKISDLTINDSQNIVIETLELSFYDFKVG